MFLIEVQKTTPSPRTEKCIENHISKGNTSIFEGDGNGNTVTVMDSRALVGSELLGLQESLLQPADHGFCRTKIGVQTTEIPFDMFNSKRNSRYSQ